jgi:hypothetical protein
MEDDNITEVALPGADAVEIQETETQTVNDARDAKPAVEGPTAQEAEALTLEQLNAITGKKFPTREAALKSIADTYKFVGKRKEDVAREVETKDFISRAEFETSMFYKDNPALAQHRDVIDAFAKANGISAIEAAANPSLKGLIEGAQGFAKVQSEKSVLSSSPRLKAIGDLKSQGMEAARRGDTATAQDIAFKLLNSDR